MKETDLARVYIEAAERGGWDWWPEVEGWDLVLSRAPEEAQVRGILVGVECKLRPTLAAIAQIIKRQAATGKAVDCALLALAEPSRAASTVVRQLEPWGTVVFPSWACLRPFEIAWPETVGEVLDSIVQGSKVAQLPMRPGLLTLPAEKGRGIVAGSPSPNGYSAQVRRGIRLYAREQARGFVTRADVEHFELDGVQWFGLYLANVGDGRYQHFSGSSPAKWATMWPETFGQDLRVERDLVKGQR